MKRIHSIDFLRGLGVCMVIILHTGFYYFDGIYDVDMANPSLIITLIGFLLMFAGLFAMLSGASYTIQFLRTDDPKKRIRGMVFSGLMMFVVAYAYFILTGPGIIHFNTRSMDESLLVSFLRSGSIQPLTQERLFYVDSLVMISFNILLLALLFWGIQKTIRHPKAKLGILLGATAFMVLSFVRIPLYNIYLQAVDQQNYVVMLSLNWLVAKNNPILPFYAFALFGVWIGLYIESLNFKAMKKAVLPVAGFYVIAGIVGYILTPETMLERAIDPTWYFIMVMQIGLCLLMILGAYAVFDVKAIGWHPITKFIRRFGHAGLTAFFWEQILSALLFAGLNLIWVVEFNIPGALLFGLVHLLIWGFILMAWERHQYRYSIEWLMSQVIEKNHNSSKKALLEAAHASR
ncbi:acyltransferase [Methanobacterium sp. YSL]|nr:acyltransferase [Methanobacterium sp. YSL]